MVSRLNRRRLWITMIVLALALAATGLVGCRKGGPATPETPGDEAGTGPGLPTPRINQQGELELVYGDARGTVKLGVGKGKVEQAALSPDRQQLVYVVAVTGESGQDYSQRIYYVNASSGTLTERELTEARDHWPVGGLAWSPCSQYLAIDSGTSAAVRPLLLLKPATGEVIGSCQAFGFVWSPTTPSRLAVGLISGRQLMPITELDRTIDLVVVDLPSGRSTILARGGTTDSWRPTEWTADGGLVAGHSYFDFRKDMDETVQVSVPARPASADAVPSGSGPLPAGMIIRCEVDFGGQLLLVDNQGAVQRQLTDWRDGRVFDAAMSADGSVIAYAWLAKDEHIVRLRTVHLPDLAAGEVALALTEAERGDAPIGYGPQQLAFAPGPGHVLLANFHGWRPDDRVQVYDLDSGDLLLDRRLWMPAWAPGAGTPPLLIAGARTGEAATTDPAGFGAELSLVRIDVTNGATAIIKAGSETESWWPQGFDDRSHLRCLLVGTSQHVPDKVTEVIVTLPE